MEETTTQVEDVGQESAHVEEDASHEGADEAQESSKKPQPSLKELPPEIAQIKRDSQKRFDEAAKLRKEAEADKQAAIAEREQIRQFIELSQKKPRELERIYGRDKAKKIAEDLLYHFFEDEQLTEDQRKERAQKEQDQKDLEDYRKWKADQEKEKEEKEKSAKTNEIAGSIETEIVEALKDSGLKPSPRTIARIAEQLQAQITQQQPRNAKNALERVKQDYKQDFSDLFAQMSGEQIAKEYPELVKKMREYELSRVERVPSFRTGAVKPQSNGVVPPPKKQTIDEYFKHKGA